MSGTSTPLAPAPALEQFLARYPSYLSTTALDDLRAREYPRLDSAGHAYLDYTGGGLYAESQVRRHFRLLESGVYGNPHSQNPTSSATTSLVEQARAFVLEYFHADPEDYVAIFTANASAALKLVGEAYPFTPQSRYLLTFDNHNSVNGIREFARQHGAAITYIPLSLPELRANPDALASELTPVPPSSNSLFAYPAQSNFSGVQHPLDWVARAQDLGWDVLLDVAAFVSSNHLDLRLVKPDYLCLSFYKMFGYPTGCGCLLARRAALAKLHRPWFSGGTITVASVQGDTHFLADGPSAFEDGTLDYLSLPAVEIGLRHLQSTGLDLIHERCRCLAGWLIEELQTLRHSTGRPMVRLFGPASTQGRGGTVTLNFYDSDGRVVDHQKIEDLASEHNISIRTGCFCNPGGGEAALELSRSELIGCFNQPRVRQTHHFTVEDFRNCIDGKSTGAVRVSFGIASNFHDAWRFFALLANEVH